MFKFKRIRVWEDFEVGDVIYYKTSDSNYPVCSVVVEKSVLNTKNANGEYIKVIVVCDDGDLTVIKWSELRIVSEAYVAFSKRELSEYYNKGGK